MSIHLDPSEDREAESKPTLAGTVVSIAIVTAGMVAIALLAAFPGAWLQ